MPLDIQDYKVWKQRIIAAEQYQAQQHERWKRANDLYSMRYWQDLGFSGRWNDTIVPVNYATTFVTTLVSAIYARNPKIFVRARRPRFDPFSQTMEVLQDRQWDEAQMKEVMIQVTIDAVLTGIGWLELGFVPTDGDVLPESAATVNGKGLIEKVKQAFGKNRVKDALATQGTLEEAKQRGEFYNIRRSPYDVLVPKGFSSYWNLPYIMLHDRLLVEDFLANPHWQAKDRLGKGSPIKHEATGNKIVGPQYQFGSSSSGTPSDEMVVDLYTIWDRRSQSVFTLSKESEEAHRDPEDWPHYAEGFPAIPLIFNRVPNTATDSNFYPFGDIEPIVAQVLEKAKIRTGQVEHRKRANLVVFVQRGSTTIEEMNAYAGATGAVEVVPVQNIQAIQVAPPIQIPPAFTQTEQSINSDLDRDSGLQLILADTQRTASIERATVATIAQGNANLKTGYRVDRLEAFAKSVARYQAGLFWQYMSKFDVGQILGTMPSPEEWKELPSDPQLARSMVRRELEFRIEAGSTRPIQDDVLDREQFIRATAVVQQVAPDVFNQIKRQWLAEMVKRFRVPTLENLILQATNENQLKEAQMENQLMAQGMLQVVSDGDDHQLHIQVHQQGGQSPVTMTHIKAHMMKLQEQQAVQRGSGQGVRQSAASPSAAEVGRMGTPAMSDIQGQSMNLRAGTGAESVRT